MNFWNDWDNKRGHEGAQQPGQAFTSVETSAYGRQALDEELERLRLAHQGERNNTLNVVAFSVFQLVEAGHVNEREAYEQLDSVAQSKGLTRSEIARTMASARSAASRKQRSNVPEPGVHQSHDTQEFVFDVSQYVYVDNPYAHLYLPRSRLAELPKPEPLIDGALDKRAIAMLVGRDQSFKSFIALAWAASVATGTPWLGRKAHQGRVLVVVGEGAYGLDSRLNAWEQCYGEISDEALTVRREPVNLFKQGPDFIDLIERAQGYDLIVLDTLQRMSSGAEANSARDAGLIVGALDKLRRASDGTVLVIAHSGKSDIDARGSSALEDDLDMVWRSKLDEDSQLVNLWLDKRKDGPANARYELYPRQVPGTNSLVLQQGKPLGGQPPEHNFELLQRLADAGTGGESKTTLGDILGLSMRKLYTAAKYLETQGLAVRIKRGQQTAWEITSEGLSKLSAIEQEHKDT